MTIHSATKPPRTGTDKASGKGLSVASRRVRTGSITNSGGRTAAAPREFRAHALRLPADTAGLRSIRRSRARCRSTRGLACRAGSRRARSRWTGPALRAKDKVLGGEQVRIGAQLAADDRSGAPEPMPLTVVYQDHALLVIDKPAGLGGAPRRRKCQPTLQNALLALDPKLAVVPRAGLVHRLDKDTSGLLVVARTPEAHTALSPQLAARSIKREYQALCQGVMTAAGRSTRRSGAIARSARAWQCSPRTRARHAHRIARAHTAPTLVRVHLETGRTHQIRVHLAHVGSRRRRSGLWGRARLPAGGSRRSTAALNAFPRQALHAARWS